MGRAKPSTGRVPRLATRHTACAWRCATPPRVGRHRAEQRHDRQMRAIHCRV